MIARWLAASLFFLLLVVAWHLAVKAGMWSPLLLPSPLSVFEYLRSAVEDGTLLEATWVTVQRLLIGYGLGILAGLPLGLLTASSRWCQDTIGVLALGLQTLPSVCWVPLALLWFGQTEASLLFVVVMGTLWSLIIATDNGVRNIPPIYTRAARSMGSTGLHTWTHVVCRRRFHFC
jgi:NitT/TauT family transport system permease protein